MYRILIFFLFPALIAGALIPEASAQPSAAVTDSVTWKLYNDKAWEALLEEADRAIREDIDFYYLRVRAGVAAWELKKYRKAAEHLGKARQEYAHDDFTNGYLYSSLLLAGRDDEARHLAGILPEDAVKRLGMKAPGLLNTLSAGTLLTVNREHSRLAEESIAVGSFLNYRSVLRRQWYKNAGADLHLSPGVNLYQNFSHISIARTQHFTSAPNQFDALVETTASQFQWYVQGRTLLGKGWSAFASASLLWGESPYHLLVEFTPGRNGFTETSFKISDQLVNAGIACEMRAVRPQMSVTFGKINGFSQAQANGQLAIYPLGNLNFYLVTDASLHRDKSTKDTKMVFSQKAALKTGPFWLIGEATRGSISNFSSGEGLVVYNIPETISGITGGTLWIPLMNYRMDLSLRYLVTEKKGTTFVYDNTVDYLKNSYRFNDHSMLITLKWNF